MSSLNSRFLRFSLIFNLLLYILQNLKLLLLQASCQKNIICQIYFIQVRSDIVYSCRRILRQVCEQSFSAFQLLVNFRIVEQTVVFPNRKQLKYFRIKLEELLEVPTNEKQNNKTFHSKFVQTFHSRNYKAYSSQARYLQPAQRTLGIMYSKKLFPYGKLSCFI